MPASPRLQFLECLELRVQKDDRHEVPRALTHALLEQLIRAVQAHKDRIDDVAVGALECGAAHNGTGVLVREKAA